MARKKTAPEQAAPKKTPETVPSSESGPSAALRQIIHDRGLTGYAIAQAANLKRPDTLYRWLSGDRGMHLSTFDAVCEALGLKLVATSETATTSTTDTTR